MDVQIQQLVDKKIQKQENYPNSRRPQRDPIAQKILKTPIRSFEHAGCQI